MKKKLQHTLKVSILLIFASPPVLSRAAEATPETQKESLKETHTLKKVRVGYLNYPGYQEGEGDEPKSGYGYEYLQQIAYYAGWEYEYVNGSFNELLEMLKNGEIDIMGDLSYTAERAQDILFAKEEQGRYDPEIQWPAWRIPDKLCLRICILRRLFRTYPLRSAE